MTGTTPKPGAAPSCEGGPGAPPSAGLDNVLARHGARRASGLALRLAEADQDGERLEIVVVDEEDRPFLSLGTHGEDEVVAVWRALGAASGLPLALQHADGRVDRPYPQIGPLRLGEIRIRRRHGLLSGRRPRFLTRRKTGEMPVRPLVFREREIAAGERA